MAWISLFENVLFEAPIGMLLSSCLCMLPGLIYIERRLKFASIVVLQNVNMLQ